MLGPMAPVVLNNTVLRDGHQSLAATRMTTAQMLPAAGPLDALGFGALETWGGATIDAALRFLHEHPFERLTRLKAAAPRTPQMMLLRGQNLVQYTSFPDDVVEAFVACTARRGLDVFRVFDALNDTRNLRTAIRAVKSAGRHAQGVICYTTSPVHTLASLVAVADELVGLGVDSLCLKDMAGLLTPHAAHELVRALRRRHACPLVVHSHDTAGLAVASYLAAIDAGADAIETSIAPFANGTGQPDTVRMLAALAGHPRAPSLDAALLLTLRRHFEQVASELAAFMSPANERVDCDALTFQVPGGMLSNFRTQLAEQHLGHRFHEVMLEVPVVRAALGWIPLVTPTSQIVGTQAVLNVKFGRWRNLAPATVEVALGRYGRPPGPVDPDLLALARRQADREPLAGRPADELAPRMPALRAELAEEQQPHALVGAVEALREFLGGEVERLPGGEHGACRVDQLAALGRSDALEAAGARELRGMIGGETRERRAVDLDAGPSVVMHPVRAQPCAAPALQRLRRNADLARQLVGRERAALALAGHHRQPRRQVEHERDEVGAQRASAHDLARGRGDLEPDDARERIAERVLGTRVDRRDQRLGGEHLPARGVVRRVDRLRRQRLDGREAVARAAWHVGQSVREPADARAVYGLVRSLPPVIVARCRDRGQFVRTLWSRGRGEPRSDASKSLFADAGERLPHPWVFAAGAQPAAELSRVGSQVASDGPRTRPSASVESTFAVIEVVRAMRGLSRVSSS